MRWVCKSAFPSVAAVRRRLSSSAALLASSSTSILPLSPKERIVYITDIEGDFEYWQRYLVNSSVLKSSTSNKHASSSKPSLPPSTLELEDNVHLVYGGDVCDRGYGDLRILQDLISLKERYPRQVHFVLGNRDINKLRLFFALNPLLLQHVHANTYWTSRNEQSRKQAMEDVQAGDAIGKLKWILGKTMGAPIAFKCRQQELQTLSSSIEEDDHAVVKSYLQSMDPENGLLMKFLSYGQISLILGDNLFVHGAIHDYNMGWLPSHKNAQNEVIAENRVECVRDWTESINSFAQLEMERYRKHAKSYLETFPKALLQSSSSERSMTSKGWLWEETGGYNHPQPGSGLIQYGMGALADRINPSVIYSTYLKNGVAMPLSPQVAQWLTKAGIRRLIVGHQPNGDAPWIMKEECTDTSGNKQQIQVVCADNAYAKSVQWPSSHFQLHSCYSKAALNNVDSQIPHGYLSVSEFEKLHHLHALGSSPHNITTRGNSVMNEVLIEIQDNKESTLSVRGTLTDGCTYRYTLPAKKHEDHDLIGKKTMDGWYVKATNIHFPNESQSSTKYALLAQSNEGFVFKNKLMAMEELLKQIQESR